VSPARNRGSDRFTTAGADITPAQRVAASRFVLRKARSREDLRLLLDALGLNTTTSKDNS
jgi:hypothetical protein